MRFKKQSQVTWLAFFASLGSVLPHAAAIITFGPPGNNFTSPPGTIGSDEGKLFTGGGGTAISSQVMLTATHVSGNSSGIFTYNNLPYNMVVAATLDDLAIWQTAPSESKTFSNFAPLYTGSSEINLPVVDVGYGVQRSSPITGGWLWGAGNGQLSWGTNTISAIDTDAQLGDSGSFGGDYLQYDFNNNPTDPNEGIVANGDSGGGLFVLNNGVYQLAGVNSQVNTVLDSSGAPVQGALYDQNGYFTQNYPKGPLIPITTDTPDSSYAARISSKLNLVGVVDGAITPANAASFPINNDGALSIYANMTTGAITGDPTLAIGTPFTPPVTATLQIAPNSGESDVSTLTIAAGCSLDITNTHMIIDDITPAMQASIQADLASGFNGGKWNGAGINSSTAALGSHYGVGMAGAPTDAGLGWGQLEIAYALYGDTNLDGVVNGADFATIVTSLGKSVTTGWQAGDFNYDGVVNSTDFTLFIGNFGKSSNGTSVDLPSSDWAALYAYAAANDISLASIPEPSCLGLLGFAGLSLCARRRPRS
jgi:Dockerin type I domain